MTNAIVWRNIIGQGIVVPESVSIRHKHGLIDNIIKAPIIISNIEGIWGNKMMDKTYDHLSIPFDQFWVEGRIGTWSCGILCQKVSNVLKLFSFVFINGAVHWIGNCDVSMVDYCVPVTHLAILDYNSDLLINGMLISNELVIYLKRIVLETLVVLGCKNVSLDCRELNVSNGFKKRINQRTKNRVNEFRYYVLVVRPPGASSKSTGTDLDIMPFHVCRGHFREYGPGFNKGLLFGKYAGRFYINPFTKGNKENGQVEKDYLVADSKNEH